MLQDLAALAAPAIVCVAFLIGAWAVIRRELAPKRRQRANARRQLAAGGVPAAASPGAGGPAVPAADAEPAEREQADAEEQRRS
jgi:hypothetical protein